MHSIFSIEHEADYLKNKSNIDINEIDERCNNAFFTASLEKMQWLLRHGCNIDNVNDYHQNALFSQNIDNKSLLFLIENGIDTQCRDYTGKTPLFHTIKPENTVEFLERIDILIAAGVNPHAVDNAGNHVLFDFNQDSVDILRKFLEYGVNINKTNNSNRNALFFASLPVFKFLVENKINYQQLDESGANVLFYPELCIGTMKSNYTCTDYLIKNTDIDFKVVNNIGESALYNLSNESILYLLKNKKIHANETIDKMNRTLIFQGERAEILDELLQYGADINHNDHKNENALFWNSLDMSKKLINAGIDINHLNSLGNNVLFKYIQRGFRTKEDEQISNLLISSGIDYTIYPSIPSHMKEQVAMAEKQQLSSKVLINEGIKKVSRI